jgi:uncharacterized protein YdgA (DUF945 family)
MRKLVIAIGIIAVLVLASPFVIGILAEGNLRERLETINTNELVALRVASYDRGWLNSTARLELGLGDAYLTQIETLAQQPELSQMMREFNIPVIVEFAHGPILVGETSGIGFLGVNAYPDRESQPIQLVQTFLGIPYLFELRGKSGFGSGFQFSGEMPAFDGAFADISYNSSGIEVTGVATRDHVQFDAVLDEASVQSPFMSGVLESFTMQGDSALRPGQFSLGTTETTLGRLTAINPISGSEPAFTAENLSVATKTSENPEGTHLDMELIYRIGRIAVANAFEVSDAALGLRLGHIDSAAVNRLIEAASSMQTTADPMAMAAQLMPLLDQVVAGSPEITLDPVQFSLPEGNFTGRLHVGLDGTALPTGSINDFMNPAVALGAVTADADLSASKPLVAMIAGLVAGQNMPNMTGPDGQPLPPEQIAAMVDAQVAQSLTMLTTFGIVSDSGANYTCTVRLAAGALTANGQPVPLPF